jgi:hypothetical protein
MNARKKRKKWNSYLQGGVFKACKWERINNCPLHVNFKIVAFQTRFDLLKKLGIILMEKQHSPIRGLKKFHEIKIDIV